MCFFKYREKELEHENEKLKSQIKCLEATMATGSPRAWWESTREKNSITMLANVTYELKKSKERIEDLEDLLMQYRKEGDSWYKLRAELMGKDKEIETLKAILEFSKEDEQEWEDHKSMFDYMIKKRKMKDCELDKWYSEAVKQKNNVERLEKEIKIYRDLFSGRDVKIILNDKEMDLKELIG